MNKFQVSATPKYTEEGRFLLAVAIASLLSFVREDGAAAVQMFCLCKKVSLQQHATEVSAAAATC